MRHDFFSILALYYIVINLDIRDIEMSDKFLDTSIASHEVLLYLHFPDNFKSFVKFLEKMGYQIFDFIPTHLYQIISDFPEPTHPPNCRISYVDGP